MRIGKGYDQLVDIPNLKGMNNASIKRLLEKVNTETIQNIQKNS